MLLAGIGISAWVELLFPSHGQRPLADLDRAGLVERRPDPADRWRTIVQIIPGQAALIGHWLDGPEFSFR